MKILDSTKALSTLVSDSSNGLGQIQPLSCTVTEELNGIYELDFTVSVTDKHYQDLKSSGLVKVEVGDGSEQIFRVYRWEEPINMVASAHCQHITYDLSKVIVKPFEATGAVNIKNALVTNMLGSYPFNTWTDITNTTSTFKNEIPRYFRECLGGYEGSVLDVLRPEYEWDNLTVKLHARRGADNNVRISYGKNLVDYSQEQNNENVYDGVYGYAVVDEQEYHATNYYNKTGATYPRILNVDFSSDYESGEVPTSAELLQYATQYATNNSIEVPSINIKIDFVPLWQTEEYKNILPLERVSLGDTVHVYFDKLNVEASSRVIKTEWNVLTKKYDSIELGDAKANLNTIITDSVSTAVDEAVSDLDIDTSYIESKLTNITSLIANGLGLHITQDSQGRIILHNAETIAQSQYQYMITAQGFMLSEDYGQTWSSGWTTGGDAVLNSLSTITLKALEIYGSTITGTIINFGDLNDKYITAQNYEMNGSYVGVSFDGNGYVRFQPTEQFYVRNLASSGTNAYNTFVMNKAGSFNQPYIVLTNYDDSQNYISANFIEMDAHYYDSSSPTDYYNRTIISNRSTATGTSLNGNYLMMRAYADRNYTYLRNFKPSSGEYANHVYLNATASSTEITLQNYFYNANYIGNRIYVNSSSARNAVDISNTRQNGTAFTDYANRILSEAYSGNSYFRFYNYKADHDSYANLLEMRGVPLNSGYENHVYLENYDVDGTNIANALRMSKTSAQNTIYLTLYRGGTSVAQIGFLRSSSGLSVTMQTFNSSYGYRNASVQVNGDGNVYATGDGFYWNGTKKW